jgi:hypothetical protein
MQPRPLVILVLFALPVLSGCATAERIGAADDAPGASDGCVTDLDCFDGDPCTEDRCGDDGACVNEGACIENAVGDPSTVCDDAPEIDGDARVDLGLLAATGKVDAVTPLEEGAVFRLVVREPRRIRVVASKPGDDAYMVLLGSCANAAATRLAWGRDIYSGTVDPGQYILAVFAGTPGLTTVDFHFLKPTPCSGAEPIPPNGLIAGTVDGFADDFTGSCLPPGAQGHRGDRVFTFTVPGGEAWNVWAELMSVAKNPSHYMYLRRGCAGNDAVEVACATDEDTPVDWATVQRTHFGAEGLEPGEYYLFVDAVAPEDYDVGGFFLAVLAGSDSQSRTNP